MNINARNLAAALTYLGADVESALLELASVSPHLDAKVRRELFRESEPAKLHAINDRHGDGLRFIALEQPRWICAMHAIDQICLVLDDNAIVQYLKAKFQDYDLKLQELVCHTTC